MPLEEAGFHCPKLELALRNPARKKRRRREQRKELGRPQKSRRGKPQRRARKERSSPERGGTSRVKAEAHPGSRKREIPMKEKLKDH